MRKITPLLVLSVHAAASSPAQLPDGSAVVASFANASNPNGGLFVVDRAGAATAIGGLPAELASANFVLREPTTPEAPARLLAGNLQSTAGADAWVYVLEVASNGGLPPYVASIVDAFLLGQKATWAGARDAGVHQAAWIPGNRRVILATGGLATGPTAGHRLWFLDLKSRTFTAVPLGTYGNLPFNAVTVSADGSFAYASQSDATAAYPILEVPLTAGSPRVIATMPTSPTGNPWFATGLLWDCRGTLVATASASPLSTPVGAVLRFTPNPPPNLWSVTVTSQPAMPILQGGALDPVDCSLLLVTGNAGNIAGMAEVFRLTSSGTVTSVSRGPAAGWGSPSGIDFDPNPEAYGAGTATAQLALAFAFRPFPGGPPALGNAGFGLAVRTSAAPLVTALVAGTSPAQPPIPLPVGGSLLVMPPLVFLGLLPGADPFFPLPIPSAAWLSGARLCCQAFGVDSALRVASSEGVAFTLW